MYKFKHYSYDNKFLSEVSDHQNNYHYVTFSDYIFVNDIIEIYKINTDILGTKTEKLIEKRRV